MIPKPILPQLFRLNANHDLKISNYVRFILQNMLYDEILKKSLKKEIILQQIPMFSRNPKNGNS
jgi:hypothetical protein